MVSPSAMIKRRVAAANALRTLAVIPHPLGPSTGGQWPLTIRYEPWWWSYILWAPRPEVLRKIKENITDNRKHIVGEGH